MDILKAMATLVACFAVTAVAIADETDAAEMKRVQGRFERTFQNPAGVRFRTVKEIGEGQSVVTTYDDVGNIVEAHTSEFKLEKRGPVRVFTFFNRTVLAGPNKGHKDLGTFSYIYRAEDNYFVDVWGLLEEDSRPPLMHIWRRLKDNE